MAKTTHKYEDFVACIESKIIGKQYSQGEALPSVRKFVQEYELSPTTVMKGLRLLEDRGVINCYPQRGYFVASRGESPVNQIAFVTLALNAEANFIFSGITKAISVAPEYAVGLFASNANLEKYDNLINNVLRNRPAGLILTATPDSIYRIDYDAIKESKIPTVVINKPSHQIEFDIVEHYNEQRASLVVEHLYRKGYRSVRVLIPPILNTSPHNDFLMALRKKLDAYGIALKKEHLLAWPAPHGFDSTPDPIIDIQERMVEYLRQEEKFDVLVTSHDYPAIGAIKAMIQEGYKVPDDIAVISAGFCAYNHQLHQRLTGINLHQDQIGEIAGELLLKRINGDKSQPRTVYSTVTFEQHDTA